MVSIPLGPIGVVCIQKTIQKGRLAGFVSGSGAALADTFYATVAALGLGYILNFIKEQEFYLQLLGSFVLIAMGTKIYLTNPVKQLRRQKKGKRNLLGDFLSIFILTVSNPFAAFVFVAVFASTSVLTAESGFNVQLLLILGVLLGALSWWYLLSTVINIFRKRFRLKQLYWINKISGIVIAVLGILLLIASFEPIKSIMHS